MLKHFGSDSAFSFGVLCLSKMTPGSPLGMHVTQLEGRLPRYTSVSSWTKGKPLGSVMKRSTALQFHRTPVEWFLTSQSGYQDEKEDFSEVLQQAAPSKRSIRCWAFEERTCVVGQMVLSLWHATVAASQEVELTSQSWWSVVTLCQWCSSSRGRPQCRWERMFHWCCLGHDKRFSAREATREKAGSEQQSADSVLPFMCSRTSSRTANCSLIHHGGCPEEAPGPGRDSRLPWPMMFRCTCRRAARAAGSAGVQMWGKLLKKGSQQQSSSGEPFRIFLVADRPVVQCVPLMSWRCGWSAECFVESCRRGC